MRKLYAALPCIFPLLLSSQTALADICDVKLSEIAYDYVTVRSDTRLLHAYEKIACSVKFQTMDEARRNGFGLETLTELGMINANGQFDVDKANQFYDSKCDQESEFTSTADAYEYMQSTLSDNAVEIVKACRGRTGLYCQTNEVTPESVTFVADWTYHGKPISPKVKVTLTNAKFAENGQSTWRGDVDLGPNYFLVTRDKVDKEVGFVFRTDLVTTCTQTQPPVPAYRISGEISGTGTRRNINTEQKTWSAGPIDCEVSKSYSKSFNAPAGFTPKGGKTTVDGSCGSTAKGGLSVKGNSLRVTGTLAGCPKRGGPRFPDSLAASLRLILSPFTPPA